MTRGILIAQLVSGVCRMPLWPSSLPAAPGPDTARYCGAPVLTDHSYCAECLPRTLLHGASGIAPARRHLRPALAAQEVS